MKNYCPKVSAVSLYFFEKTGFWLMPAIGLLAILAGMFWAGLPAFFKSRFNVNEILSSLMLNYIAFLLLAYLVQGIFKDPDGFNFPESKLFHSAALLPILLEGTRLHIGVLITPLLLLGIWLILQRTPFISFSGSSNSGFISIANLFFT